MKIKELKLFHYLWVAFIVGLACADVGEMPKSTDPFPWYMPLIMFLIFLPGILVSIMSDKGN